MFAGGWPHGTEGKEEDIFCRLKFFGESFGGIAGGVPLASSFDSADPSSFGPAKFTSSSEDVDNRCAVSSGDLFCFRGVASSSGGGDGAGSPISSTSLSGTGGELGGRGGCSVARGVVVVADPLDWRRSVSERVAVDGIGTVGFTGADSSTSSKVSYSNDQLDSECRDQCMDHSGTYTFMVRCVRARHHDGRYLSQPTTGFRQFDTAGSVEEEEDQGIRSIHESDTQSI